MEFLGVPAQGSELEFPILGEEWREVATVRAACGLRPGEYACVHPGARASARRWAPERFAAVADLLAARGLRIVLTGIDEESEVAGAVARSMHTGCVNLAGKTPLGVLAPLLTGARLLVCNDTGISHVAEALRVPSVVIYTGSSPERWAPPDGARHRAVFAPVDCRPCEFRECPIGHPCASRVEVEEVWREAEALLVGC
jgi:ADP-heptose:LPS heptosyltransferase